jgi:phenylacetate-CoA ligase
MFETAIAQLRFGASVVSGRRLHPRSVERIVAAMRETHREFGSLGSDVDELLAGPSLDKETREAMQARRFRALARRAAAETTAYRGVFEDAGVDARRMGFADIARFPVTTKQALRDEPDAFVSRRARPFLRATTTGTTGWPASIHFTARELRTMLALSAMGLLRQGVIVPGDLVQIGIAARQVLGVTGIAAACAQIGAATQIAGAVEPAHSLALLAERRRLPGHRPQVSVLDTYPSALGELVEHGLRLGYGPRDFGLRLVILGGEIATEGLKRRCRRLFGPIDIFENYAMTELVPFGGTLCPDGHLHFEPASGVVEVRALDGAGAAAPGEPGTVVATPLPPYREATLLLRYDTEDVVRALPAPPACALADQPATTKLQGKRELAVRHAEGWTFARDVAEALEAVEAVPLPARYGFGPAPGGVAVEVVAAGDARARRAIERSLEAHGVPVRSLRVVAAAHELARPVRLRCDLREQSLVGAGGRPSPPAPHAADDERGLAA